MWQYGGEGDGPGTELREGLLVIQDLWEIGPQERFDGAP